MDTLTEVGIGMLGYAFMGRAHVNAFKTLSYMVQPPPAVPRLVAIAGRDQAAVAAAATRYGFARHYTDWRQLVADPAVQLLDNGGSNDVHADPCIAAAEAGKHVLCEKPMARDATEAGRMLDAVRRTGVKHMIGFNYRFVPAVRLAYNLIRSGELGEVRHCRAVYLQDWLSDPAFPATWRLHKQRSGSGALGDLGAHVIDLVRFLLGEPRWVTAVTRTFVEERPQEAGEGRSRVDVDDAFAALLELENGALATLESSRFALGRKNHLAFEINASKGSLRFDLERLNELEVYRQTGPEETRGWSRVLVTEPRHPYLRSWWPPGHIIGWEHTFVHEITHLLDAIVNDRPVQPYGATFEDGYRNAVICDAVLESAQGAGRVAIA